MKLRFFDIPLMGEQLLLQKYEIKNGFKYLTKS